MGINNFFKLIIAIAASEMAGVIGTIFTTPSIPTWYATLTKPVLNPPAWIFGIVWPLLYLLMGISLWLVWTSNSVHKKKAIVLFSAQLVLNALWSPIFFGGHAIGGALALIVLLWAAVVLTMTIFRTVSKPAAWLLAPYILWVSFAVYLNYSIWALN